MFILSAVSICILYPSLINQKEYSVHVLQTLFLFFLYRKQPLKDLQREYYENAIKLQKKEMEVLDKALVIGDLLIQKYLK
jgi:hypothetical protein